MPFFIKKQHKLNICDTRSIGYVNSPYKTYTALGGKTTPLGLKTGSLYFTLSSILGSYNGQKDNELLNVEFGIRDLTKIYLEIF